MISKYIKIGLLLVTLISISVIITSHWITFKAKNYIYDDISELPKNKVGLVLGTGKYISNGSINLYYQYRIDAAVTLYNSGKVEYLLISGDNSSEQYDEPTEFKNDLIAKGIPEEKIILDYAGFRTLDSVVRAKEIFGQNAFTIISQKFHNERAIYLSQNFDIEVVGYNAKDASGIYGLKTQLREYLARSKASIDVFFNVEPKFLGEKITIE